MENDITLNITFKISVIYFKSPCLPKPPVSCQSNDCIPGVHSGLIGKFVIGDNNMDCIRIKLLSPCMELVCIFKENNKLYREIIKVGLRVNLGCIRTENENVSFTGSKTRWPRATHKPFSLAQFSLFSVSFNFDTPPTWAVSSAGVSQFKPAMY